MAMFKPGRYYKNQVNSAVLYCHHLYNKDPLCFQLEDVKTGKGYILYWSDFNIYDEVAYIDWDKALDEIMEL